MKKLACLLLVSFSIVTCTQTRKKPEPPTDLVTLMRGLSNLNTRSGYGIGTELCGPFPKLQIGTRKGYCVGLVVGAEEGLRFPRNIVTLPNTPYMLVVDMGGWGSSQGVVYLLDPNAQGNRLKPLIDKLEIPHGLAIGLDGLAYVGAATKIIRFNPLATNPKATLETVIKDLPGVEVDLGGPKKNTNGHPLKHFVFDKEGNIYVNVAAPTDNCTAKGVLASGPCAQSSGAKPYAALWKFLVPPSKIFPAIEKTGKNPPFEVFATGLRNSVALTLHPGYPENGVFIQAENARDLPDPDKPNEEINLIERGKNYGWPYCYDKDGISPEYVNVLKAAGPLKDLCTNNPSYAPAFALMPPHVAPLDLLYYTGQKFPELRNTLVMTWHGYVSAANRIVFYKVDERGVPLQGTEPIRYKKTCTVSPMKEVVDDSNRPVIGPQFEELIGEWYKVSGVRPIGAPVTLEQSEDGAIWIVDDKNKTVLRMDVDPSNAESASLPCDSRTKEDVDQLMSFLQLKKDNIKRLDQLRVGLIEKHCTQCHAGFNLKPELADEDRTMAVARFMFEQEGWIYPGDPNTSQIHRRTRGTNGAKIMPEDGHELIQNSAEYRALLDELDKFIVALAPGDRYLTKPPRAPVAIIYDGEKKKECGRVPTDELVVMKNLVTAVPKMSEIYRPASKFLNDKCDKNERFLITTEYVQLLK